MIAKRNPFSRALLHFYPILGFSLSAYAGRSADNDKKYGMYSTSSGVISFAHEMCARLRCSATVKYSCDVSSFLGGERAEHSPVEEKEDTVRYKGICGKTSVDVSEAEEVFIFRHYRESESVSATS
jgi:hypothetical protein